MMRTHLLSTAAIRLPSGGPIRKPARAAVHVVHCRGASLAIGLDGDASGPLIIL